MPITRIDLQRLADRKLDDSTFLLSRKRFSSAYYLVGYAVELGLKACVAKQIRENEIPDRDLVNNVYTHQFAKLVALAGLARHLQEAQDIDRQFPGLLGGRIGMVTQCAL